MPEKVKGFTITLENNITQEDAERLKQLFLNIKGVLHIESLETSFEDHVIRKRLKIEFYRKLHELLDDL